MWGAVFNRRRDPHPDLVRRRHRAAVGRRHRGGGRAAAAPRGRPCRGAAFNRDETRILTWCDDGTARLWDAATGQEIVPPLRHEGAVSGRRLHGDETRILTWTETDRAAVERRDRGGGRGAAPPRGRRVGRRLQRRRDPHPDLVRDGTARLWDAATGEEVVPPLRHEGDVWGAVFKATRPAS